MERAEPDRPPPTPSANRVVVAAVCLVIVALGVSAGSLFRPIGTNVVDRGSAVAHIVAGAAVGVVLVAAASIANRRKRWWSGTKGPLLVACAVTGIVAVSLLSVSTAARHRPVTGPAEVDAPLPVETVNPQDIPSPDPLNVVLDKGSLFPEWVNPVIVIALIAATGALVLFVARRLPDLRPWRTHPPAPPAHDGEEIDESAVGDALERSIEALLHHPDPRAAIKAAYAVLVDALAEAGFRRIPSEAPFEHLGRCLQGLDINPAAMHQLLDLYAVARFSTHAVGEAERTSALDALRTAQQQLRQRAAAVGEVSS